MLTTEQMVEVEGFDSIQNLFANLAQTRNRIILWQNLGGPSRIKGYAGFKKVDLKNSELIFLPRKGFFEFNGNLPIYFYSQRRTAIFKNSIFYNSHHQIVIKMPEFLLLKNLRQESREPFNEMVSFMFGEDNNGKESWFKSEMIDRSVGGFSFKSSINNVIKFKAGQKIEFKFNGMPNYRTGEIVNISPYVSSQLDQKFLRISVKML